MAKVDSQASAGQQLKTDATASNISMLPYICKELSSQLADEDLWRFVFLCGDLLKDDDHRREVNRMMASNNAPASKLFSILEWSTSGRDQPQELQKRLLVELLYLTKKYKYLTQFGHCKHNLDKENKWLVSPFRRCLFELCEQITDEELRYLNMALLPKNPVAPTAEDLMEALLAQRIIGKDHFEPLEVQFTRMNRKDLREKIESYLRETSFYDLTPMEPGEKSGLAVIFNHYEFNKQRTVEVPEESCPLNLEKREGTHLDKKNLKELWEHFNFDVDVHDDLLNEQFMPTLMRYSEKPANRYKIFVLCILSHGEEGLFYTSDNAPVYLSDVLAAIGETFLSWDAKPKLIFIQACQGDRYQAGVKEKMQKVWNLGGPVTDAPKHNSLLNSPLYADMLIGNSTVPGFVSYRLEEKGSWYITALTKILNEKGHRVEIHQNLIEINNKLAAKKMEWVQRQMATFRSQLRKGLKFQQRSQTN